MWNTIDELYNPLDDMYTELYDDLMETKKLKKKEAKEKALKLFKEKCPNMFAQFDELICVLKGMDCKIEELQNEIEEKCDKLEEDESLKEEYEQRRDELDF